MTIAEVLQLVRANIQQLTPYASARSEFAGKAHVSLDANESPFDIGYNRYPDPLQQELKVSLAKIKQVPANTIFVGNGSDEPIDLLYRAFCIPGSSSVILQPPTYGMYEVSANINDVGIVYVRLNEYFQPDVKKLLNAQHATTRMLFLCSPNNPTGNLMSSEAIHEIAQNFQGIVVLDEAYIDFSPQATFLPHLARYPNLVVLQTLSKAWGLAGLRVGLAFAHPEVLAVLNKIKPPYNLSQAAQQHALVALQAIAQKESNVSQILHARAELEEGLRMLSVVEKVYPSDANFLLVKVKAPQNMYKYLLGQGIVVRDRSRVAGCEGCLRVTVGLPAENGRLLQVMASYTLEKETAL